MSTSDQDHDQDREQDHDQGRKQEQDREQGRGPEPGRGLQRPQGRDQDADGPIAGPDGASSAEAGGAVPDGAASGEPDRDEPAPGGGRLTPRQARRLRVVLSSLGMAAMGVVLALRIVSRSSVLVVGVYGLALILCGVVIELSRNGRTRLGSWLLGLGPAAAVGADWLLLP
ncbi:hypothetical protein EES43_26865 [Streptomyces sp. ADI96-02]|uniref:hypothetical protein n=1 Tax=Streptomyces sp. ADI96-02 TaxID=1522760 RepID=UPI000FC0DE18|nr:hypothetical protein [Streptomyces sp. ADI96-02]RPK55283.1 hypothetical protein EES43_26865 [Streptomyces sp. ADI96-02]